MRIAFINPHLTGKGGLENVLAWLAGGMAARGHEVTMISRRNDLSLWNETRHSNIISRELPLNAFQRLDKCLESRAAGKFLVEMLAGMDVVCVHKYPAYWWLYAAQKDQPRPTPSIWYCHEPNRSNFFSVTDAAQVAYYRSGEITMPNHRQFIKRIRSRLRQERFRRLTRVPSEMKAIRSITRILANSHHTASHVERIWGRQAHTCYPGIPAPTGREPLPFEQRKNILALSAMMPHKNTFGILGAFDLVVNQLGRKDITLHLAGSGPKKPVHDFIHQHRLENHVRVHGFLSNAEKSSLMGSVQLCVFVPFAEPLGLVTMEAFAHGTPVIGSNHGGPAELINDGVTGLLVNPFDPSDIAKGILHLYNNLPLLIAMSKAGKTQADEEFGLDRFVGEFELHAREVIASSR